MPNRKNTVSLHQKVRLTWNLMYRRLFKRDTSCNWKSLVSIWKPRKKQSPKGLTISYYSDRSEYNWWGHKIKDDKEIMYEDKF